jgi:hypothetical protein
VTRHDDEEDRAFLQARIAQLFKTMFWSITALIVFLALLYALDPDNAPDARRWVYLQSAIGLGAMALIWRVLLVRRPLPQTFLHALDLVYSLGIGTSFGIAAYLQHDLRAAGYLSLVYTAFTVFARALIVPSSGTRTAITSSLTYVPMAASALALALRYPQDVPARVFFVGFLLLCIVPLVMSAYGSNIIYGLRRKASAAEQLGAYSLGRKIGEGGMGTVYRAHHVLLRRDTAVKIVSPDRVGKDTLERFEKEVQHMSQLTHPNTVAVYDYGHSDGVFYYAMEYLGGGIDLEQLVRRHGAQSSARVAQIMIQACGALHEAHTKKIIHRDIKPPNIILCERGGMPDVVKVVDYGLVKEITAETSASTQIILGTPAYVAPEAVTDPGSIGPGVDIYALGCVGYFLLTGRRVFDGKTAVDICIQHVTKAPTPPSEHTPGIDPALEEIIVRCLAKQPAGRYESAVELRSALREVATKAWTDADARAWWTKFRAIEEHARTATETPTRTITVNIDARLPDPT